VTVTINYESSWLWDIVGQLMYPLIPMIRHCLLLISFPSSYTCPAPFVPLGLFNFSFYLMPVVPNFLLLKLTYQRWCL
jgi:hypothetical protein